MSSRNARPRKIAVIHGGHSASLLHDQFDGRTNLSKLFEGFLALDRAWLKQRLGRELTEDEFEAAADVSRLKVIKRIAWEAVKQAIAKGDQEARALATTEYMRVGREIVALQARYEIPASPDQTAAQIAARRALQQLTDEELNQLRVLLERAERRATVHESK